MYISYIIIAVIVILWIQNTQFHKAKQQMINRLKAAWGKHGTKKLTTEQLDYISYYFKKGEFPESIDDITWQDLDMDLVFQQIDTTNSSVGQEYLYKMLRTPEFDKDSLKKKEETTEAVSQDESGRLELQKIFCNLGFCKRFSAFCYIDLLRETPQYQNRHHYFLILLLAAASVLMITVSSGIGIFLFLGVLAYCIADYYRYKGKIENYYSCVKYVAKMSHCSLEIARLHLPYVENETMEYYGNLFAKVRRKLVFLTSGNDYAGSLADMLMDYFRMITHIDIIMYNQIIKMFQKEQNNIEKMYEALGYLESMITVASYRNSLTNWCRPVFHSDRKGLSIKEIYHPFIAEPVVNSIDTTKCVLITGSNASGKSTFLRTVAINAILAQTIHTCTARSYETQFYQIFSSMSLKDNLLNGESYFMVEIKALQRILSKCSENSIPVLCFVDEVLRGTNTVERIAASSQILAFFQKAGAMCFAATHDIELTKLLENLYVNYHFEEQVMEEDITFHYQLQPGPAVTRNAIKLLKMMHYDENIIENAEKMAKHFMENGSWYEKERKFL